MQLSDLKTVLAGVLPGKVTYYMWPVNESPALPFICFYATGADNFGADNIVYHSNTPVRIELYEELKDLALEGQLEAAFTASELFWTREETYIDDEHCYMIIYEVTIHGREQG